MFSYKYFKIFKNNYFLEHLRTTASVHKQTYVQKIPFLRYLKMQADLSKNLGLKVIFNTFRSSINKC